MDAEKTSTSTVSMRPTILRMNAQTSGKDPIQGVYRINSTKYLEEISVEEAIKEDEKSAEPSGDTGSRKAVWLDAEIHENDEDVFTELQSKVLDQLSLPPFIRRHLTEVKQLQTPQVLPLAKACMLVIRILSPDSNDVLHAAAICLKRTLVTITTTSAIQIQPKRSKALLLLPSKDMLGGTSSDRELPEATVSGGIALWLSFHLGNTTAATYKLRSRIFALTEQMDTDIGSITLASILELKDSFLRISAVAEEQNECVESLADADLVTEGLNFKNLKGSLGMLESTAGSTERMIFRLEKRLHDLRLGYDTHQQDRINYRLNVLTILSAIFLPLTLMAGIWGMNFTNMPELERENAYYYALASMATVGLSFLFGFYWYGWLS